MAADRQSSVLIKSGRPEFESKQTKKHIQADPDGSIGDVTAVNGLNLAIRKGEFFAFPGPNGAGRTTTIRILCGFTREPAFDKGPSSAIGCALSDQISGVTLRHY